MLRWCVRYIIHVHPLFTYRRKVRSDDWTTGKGSHQPRRAEVGIKIHVPNFAAKNPK